MKAARVSSLLSLLLGIGLVTSPTIIASAQEATAQGANASGLLSQLSAAFSGGKAVQQVQLSGNATWYAGGSEDSGTVSLTASIDGSSQMQLALASTGQRTETQTGAGLNATCQWAGSDGVAHEIHSGSCWRPALWFLPALSLQPSLLPGNLGVIDLGVEPVGTSATPYRHLQSQLTLSGAPDALMPDIVKMSMIDIGLDPVSHLPAVLAYSVRPDNGAPAAIAIEVHYSDYRTVNGVQIPFLIQRYLNGALQLEISINSAEIN